MDKQIQIALQRWRQSQDPQDAVLLAHIMSRAISSNDWKQNIHILMYENKYGTDVGIYLTYEDALEGAKKIMLQYIDQIQDEESQADILELLESGNIQDAMNAWPDVNFEDEFFTITEPSL